MPRIDVLKKWLSHRKRVFPVSTIVMHATAGGSLEGAISTLRSRRFSYHYLIEKSGVITKCVPSEMVAFHAGKSVGPDGSWVNRYSIGISFVNKDDGKDPYTEVQKASALHLVQLLVKFFPGVRYLTSHRQISWPRKVDPVGLSSFLKSLASACGLSYWQREGVPE